MSPGIPKLCLLTFHRARTARNKPKFGLQDIDEIQKLAAEGDAFSEYKMSVAHQVKNGPVAQDFNESVKWLQLSASHGYPEAQSILGTRYNSGFYGVPQDQAQACKYWKLGADQGCSIGQVMLAGAYEKGHGIERNLQESFRYYKLAADSTQQVDGQFKTGEMYFSGIGVTKDQKLGFRYLKLSADQGHPQSAQKVAICYQNGDGCSICFRKLLSSRSRCC